MVFIIFSRVQDWYPFENNVWLGPQSLLHTFTSSSAHKRIEKAEKRKGSGTLFQYQSVTSKALGITQNEESEQSITSVSNFFFFFLWSRSTFFRGLSLIVLSVPDPYLD